jgi:hypothetical protein
MNKKILVIAFAIMFVAMLAAPVLANSPKKIPVTATQLAVPSPGPDTKSWTTKGGIAQMKNLGGAGTATLNIPGEASLEGSCTASLDATTNSKIEVGIWHSYVKWIFATGTFEGVVKMKIFMEEGVREFHAVLQGTDAFEGWKLNLDGECPRTGTMNWEGFLLIP